VVHIEQECAVMLQPRIATCKRSDATSPAGRSAFEGEVFNLACRPGLTRQDYDEAIATLQMLRTLDLADGCIEATPIERFQVTFGHRLSPAQEEFERAERLNGWPTYQDFLDSDYWHIVREFVKEVRGKRCEFCARTTQLHVHHKTYEHHGMEHLYLKDLIVLCSFCHAKFHDKPRPGGTA